MKWATYAQVLILASGAVACTKPASDMRDAAKDPQAALIERGKRSYTSQCIACHNADPAKDGTLGPAVAGASFTLLEARVLRGEYPPGYAPKRTTKVMPPMPFLKSEMEALHAYLGSAPAVQ